MSCGAGAGDRGRAANTQAVSPSPRRVLSPRSGAAVVALLVAGGLLSATGGTAAAAPIAGSPPVPPAPVFGSPTVVDNYRPGFEPDVAVDKSPSGGGQTIYTSTPFGFSTTQSFIERSDDGAASFHNVAGNLSGKPLTCYGGGDTEAQVDPVSGSLFFSDLQGLTNFSNSRSDNKGATFSTSCASVAGVGVDRQWLALDTNGGTTEVGTGAAAGRSYFDYDNVAQDLGTLSNQLVINQSVDGVQYGSTCPGGAACSGPATPISPDEGLPGNLIVDNTASSHRHSVYAAHTNSAQTGINVSICRGAATGVPVNAAAAADYCTDPTATAPNSAGSLVSTHWHEVNVDPVSTSQIDKAFNVIAIDTAGNLYMTWASAPIDPNDTTKAQLAPAQIYLSVSTDGGETWSARKQVNAPAQATNIFPWISAGDPGHVDIAWYGSQQTTGKVPFDSDSLNTGLWDVYLAQSMDALDGAPTFGRTTVSDHHVKYGNISTGGLGGSSDRSLGDYMQVQTGVNGEAVVSYVDDTSTGRNQDFTGGTGQSPAEAAGPTMIARQVGGLSLYTAKGDLGGATARVGSVTDRAGDQFVASGGQTTAGSPAEDLSGVSVSRPDATHLTITMATKDANLAADLTPPATVAAAAGGATTAVYLVRWAERYEPTLLDGAIRYVGMQSTAGGPPSFYTGTSTCVASARCKFFSYPATTTVPGTISQNTITWTVPLSAIGNPTTGSSLYSVTGSDAVQNGPSTPPTQSLPTAGDPANTQLPVLLDAAPSFSYTLTDGPAAAMPEVGAPVLFLLIAGVVGVPVIRRRRRRTARD